MQLVAGPVVEAFVAEIQCQVELALPFRQVVDEAVVVVEVAETVAIELTERFLQLRDSVLVVFVKGSTRLDAILLARVAEQHRDLQRPGARQAGRASRGFAGLRQHDIALRHHAEILVALGLGLQ